MAYKLNDAKMFADITDGFAIVINSETGVYYGMNPFTSSIFDNLVKGCSVDAIIAQVMSFEGCPGDFPNSIDNLVKELLEKELIAPEDETISTCDVSSDYAKDCHFEISWDEFKDAQELLLADPIHEVREEEGWTPDFSSLNQDTEDVAQREAKKK